MNRDLCQRYLEDPEANASHLAECASCRAVFEELEAKVPVASVRVEALPLAAWEDAAYRAWPIVAGGALTVAAFATALFALAGESPLLAVAQAIRNAIPSADFLRSMVRLAGGAVQNVPGSWQIGIALAFVAVNAVLVALLRRSPKGVDV